MILDTKISNWIYDYAKNNNIESLVIGISGGIDSAVTSSLCAMTGLETKLLIMSIHQNINETNRGLNHCDLLKDRFSNTETIKIDLTNIYDEFVKTIPKQYHNRLSLANSRARIRMTTLYMIAGSSNGLVVGTGNKIEDFGVGFFTKYGDGGVDISPIADLTKTEVYKLASKLKINKEIIDAAPTDGLWDDGRTDEDQLGASYEDLEWAMNWYNINYPALSMNSLSNKQKKVLEIYLSHRKSNIHKMKEIPVFKK